MLLIVALLIVLLFAGLGFALQCSGSWQSCYSFCGLSAS